MTFDSTSSRISSLDGVRAMAAYMVLAFHAYLPGFGSAGFAGVDVFFVLSGFLITDLLLKEFEQKGRVNYFGFQLRRLARLYPGLMVFLVVWLAASPLIAGKAESFKEAALAAFYVSDFSQVLMRTPKYIIHTWSLSVEVHFYLVWPIVLLGLIAIARDKLASALLGLFIALCFYRILLAAFGGAGHVRLYFAPDTMSAGLVAGAWLAAAKPRFSANIAPWAGTLAIAVICAFGSFPQKFYFEYEEFLLPVFELAAVGLLVSLLSSDTSFFSRLFCNRVAAKLGIWSYGIYLWNYPVARFVREDHPGVVAFLVTTVASTALAALSYELVEKRATTYLQVRVSNWQRRKVHARA
jgi:peptidoglycan/LPS O-acetylase OafA/YrhL